MYLRVLLVSFTDSPRYTNKNENGIESIAGKQEDIK
jgi:hypothetical protein